MDLSKRKKRLIAILLCVTMVLSLNSAYAFNGQANNQQQNNDSAVLTASEPPEIISEEQIAENQHIARLNSEESDLNTIVFLNRDETATMYYFADPVKYINDMGEVEDKSNQLYSAFDDVARAENYAYVNRDNDIQTYLPKALSNDTGVLLTYDTTSIEIAPDNITSANATKIDGNYKTPDFVEYENIFGPQTKVRYTPTFNGFKEDIILLDNVGSEFSFVLRTGDLEAISENGKIYLRDSSGNTVIAMDPVYVHDSFLASDEIEADDYTHNTWNNSVKLVKVDKGVYNVIIQVDKAFLEDSRTVYPVYVDPSFTVTTSGSGSTKTIQDVPIYNGSGAQSIPSGSDTYNLLGYVGTSSGIVYGVGRVLMKFPGLLSNSTYQSLSANSITNATLNISEASGQSTSATITAYQYTGAVWTETSTTYNNSTWAGYTSPSASTTIGSSSMVTASFNITSIVQGWKNNSTNAIKGIMLKNSNETSTSYRKDMQSTESSNKPSLSITYTFYGCKPYVTDNRTTVNCHGYACFTNNWPQFMTNDDFNYCSTATTANALARTKTRMTAWLNSTFSGRWREVSGPNVALATNEWMVVMRVGNNAAVSPFDYHYWYRTNNGPWANKHGQTPSELLPASDLPTTSSSSGWKLGNQYYYNSAIVYYVITL